MSSLSIYKPDGVHKKDNLCMCGNCDIFPEYFHAMSYYFEYNTRLSMSEAIELRNAKYPNGVIQFRSNTYDGGGSFTREDGSVVTYNKKLHRWFEQDGTLHSIMPIGEKLSR